MEQVHGVDVSWMTQGSPKDKFNKPSVTSRTLSPAQPRQLPGHSARDGSAQPTTETTTNGSGKGQQDQALSNGLPIPRRLSRSSSIEKQHGPNGASPQRRNSWFSNISAKFSGSSNSNATTTPSLQPQQVQQVQQQQQPHTHTQGPPQASQHQFQSPPQSPSGQTDPPVPKINPTKNAVLQHGSRPDGNEPYTPAPPKSGQAGFLGVFRRLSSSGSGGLGVNGKLGHGLVERKVLNVDHHRARCPIVELKGAKLRKVSFCVDVEIAPMPKYTEEETPPKAAEKGQTKRVTEKGEGEALKNAKSMEAKDGTAGVDGASVGKIQDPEIITSTAASTKEVKGKDGVGSVSSFTPAPEKEMTKKKEKKKKSEEERKARKEKRRKLAEDNGSVPLEIYFDTSDSSSDAPSTKGALKTTASPTTNPVRVYRRCCQLRETPILKKITEQLGNSSNSSTTSGIVEKLDLTGYWLQLPDLVTLGDYLAVVPVREIILENSGLSDEGLRVVLAGLLATKPPGMRRRKPKHDTEPQGGFVERVVLKDNKLGPDGWKHVSLFVYMCRSLKHLDISNIPFPRQAPANKNASLSNGAQIPRSISDVFAKALAERPAGSTLEMINIGGIEPSMEQLGTIIDGLIQCGVRRLGVSHNRLDKEGVQHVMRYLESGKCEGLDLGGNDLTDHLDNIASSLKENVPLLAISLAGCDLQPSLLCKILPALVKLRPLRFIDLSHNHELFQSTPSAVGPLRRYLPKMESLKRMHLQDVNMSAEQAIALVEIVPEVRTLCHINLLGNTDLIKLANATTEEAQEEACALYASLMAATRVSKSIICVDIEVPSDESGEIVKAMAKQVVAYCLRNMEQMQDSEIGAAVASALAETHAEGQDSKAVAYPDVLVHLVGHDVLEQDDMGDDGDSAPDEDYVIGGTGVVKALTCCLKNRGDDSQRQSGEFVRDSEGGSDETTIERRLATGGKAKDMSKHLLAGARKIRLRLQPALNKAKASPDDELNLRRLTFLDETLQGIIKRFEDEFPDTREPAHDDIPITRVTSNQSVEELSATPPTQDGLVIAVSDGEDETEIHGSHHPSRSNSILSKELAEEEGRFHRAGHRFRSGFTQNLDLFSTIDDIGSDPTHMRILTELAEDLGGELLQRVREKGPVRAFKEDKELLFKSLKESDPEYWERFVEAQQKSRQNINLPSTNESNGEAIQAQLTDENAICD